MNSINLALKEAFNVFVEKFDKIKHKRIVLYGLGTLTITLINELKNYNIIGVLDRGIDNIGNDFYGVPILDVKTVHEKADVIIIATQSNYWDVIYQRIKDVEVEIYFRDGSKPQKEVQKIEIDEYWTKNYEDIYDKLDKYDIVCFDIFDTLLMRKCIYSNDVFELVELRGRERLGYKLDFARMRRNSFDEVKVSHPTLDDLYDAIKMSNNLPQDTLDLLKQMEIEVEENLSVVREDMFRLYKAALRKGKEVYLISDMYLSKNDITRLLDKCGINGFTKLYVSCEEKCNKKDGTLWGKIKNVVGDKKIIHIGDDYISDYLNPPKYGVDSYHILSAYEMLKKSSLKKLAPEVRTISDSLVLGTILARVFNSPFALSESQGRFKVNDFEQLGYTFFAPVVYSFLVWIVNQSKDRNIKNLLFFARDGYFLTKHYDFLVNRLDMQVAKSVYVKYSRRIGIICSITNDKDLNEAATITYRGTFKDYMYHRFDVVISEDDQNANQIINAYNNVEELLTYMEPYREEIWEHINAEKEAYSKYCREQIPIEDSAVVDLWYRGTGQHYFSKIIGKKVLGFYCIADLSKDNICARENEMIACFQEKEDIRGTRASIARKNNSLIFESVMTAPYGMFRKCDYNGVFYNEADGENQKNFGYKEIINDAVTDFIIDITRSLGIKKAENIPNNPMFCAEVFNLLNENNQDISKYIKDSFFSEDIFTANDEYNLFE